MKLISVLTASIFALSALAWPLLQVVPFEPEGGLGTSPGDIPQYIALSDFDWQSLNLALNQEWIESDLFHHGLAQFSEAEFDAAGINAEYRYLIQWMAEQEVGHATLLTNILGPGAAKPCTYQYPFNNVREFVDFCQKLTSWGESGVYGFLEHLNSRAAATLLLQTVATDARQQMVFRQFEGLFPMPVWFLPGLTQSMTWTLLSPFLVSCPAENPHIEWQIFPTLNILNNPSAVGINNSSVVGENNLAAISRNRSTPLSVPGQEVFFTWELPGRPTSYNGSYTTNSTAGPPQFAMWISQLNITYTPLRDINGQFASSFQPGLRIFGDDTAPIVNGTTFVAITDADLFVTPFNLSQVNSHIVAGPAVYQAG